MQAAAWRTLAAWTGSPAAREEQDRAALVHDWQAIEALGDRLG